MNLVKVTSFHIRLYTQGDGIAGEVRRTPRTGILSGVIVKCAYSFTKSRL